MFGRGQSDQTGLFGNILTNKSSPKQHEEKPLSYFWVAFRRNLAISFLQFGHARFMLYLISKIYLIKSLRF